MTGSKGDGREHGRWQEGEREGSVNKREMADGREQGRFQGAWERAGRGEGRKDA